MASYTMELINVMEMLTHQSKHVEYPMIGALIESARPLIFNFDYPLFDPNYKRHLETIFLQRYLFHEINDTPVRRWQIYLMNRMNQEMPVLNKYYEAELLKFDPLTNYKTLREGNRNGNETFNSDTSDKYQSKRDSTRIDNTNRTETGTADSLVKQTNTPQSEIDDFLNGKYLSAAEKTDSNSNNNIVDDSTINDDSTVNDDRTINRDDTRHSLDTYLENLSGYTGISPSKLIQEYRDSFINVDNMFIKRMSPLFFSMF